MEALCYKPALRGRKNPALGRIGSNFRVGVAAAPSRGSSLNMNVPWLSPLDGLALALPAGALREATDSPYCFVFPVARDAQCQLVVERRGPAYADETGP
jgi:hypothetical protein